MSRTVSNGLQSQPVEFIAMYGGTGVGKSTFVNDATRRSDMPVGHDLNSCTQQVVASQPFVIDGRSVVLFDTPGFDDTNISDADTLKRIAEFLETMYRQGMKLKGLVYLHRITDVRMMGASARTFRLLRKLCGTESLSNVIICLQMWSNPPTEDELLREKQLKNEFFKPALDNGAQLVRRMESGTDTAHEVLRMLLPKEPKVMHIQYELVNGNIRLEDTDAGKEVEMELRRKLNKQENDLRELRVELSTAVADNDSRLRDMLQEHRKKKENEMVTVRQQLALLKMEIEEGKRFWDNQFKEIVARRAEYSKQEEEQGLGHY